MRWSLMATIVFLVCAARPSVTNGQTVVKDYVIDRHAHYSPDDFYRRGHVYRAHTGHAGLFRNCDDDALKRYSPYIHWQQRPDPSCRLPYFRVVPAILGDLDERLTRLVQGAGNCSAGNCSTGNCSAGNCICGSIQGNRVPTLIPSVRQYPPR